MHNVRAALREFEVTVLDRHAVDLEAAPFDEAPSVRRARDQIRLLRDLRSEHRVFGAMNRHLGHALRRCAGFASFEFCERSVGVRRRMKARCDLKRKRNFRVAWIHGFGRAFRFHRRNISDRFERKQVVVIPHQLVGNRHHFAEDFARRFGEADVVVFRLTHLLRAIETDEKRHRQNALLLLPVLRLQRAAHEQIEFLVGAAELDIRL